MRHFPKRRNNRLDINRPAVVYGIYDPLSKELMYVGYTVNFKLRVSYHLNNGLEKNKKAIYINGLKKMGLIPIIEIIRHFDNVPDALEFEQKTIIELNPVLNTKTYAQQIA